MDTFNSIRTKLKKTADVKVGLDEALKSCATVLTYIRGLQQNGMQ